jgi:hypothetical protein
MSPSANFCITEYGSPWPSGNFEEIAMIDVSYEDVRKFFSSDLIEGFEEGMGPWKAVGIRLDEGEVVELIRYAYDSDQAFTLRVDANANFANALRKILVLLGKSAESLKWVSPLVSEYPCGRTAG